MQITITNGTLTQIKETLTPASGMKLPVDINVAGSQYDYNDITGIISLSDPTGNVTVTAAAMTVKDRTIADLTGLADIINERSNTGVKMSVAAMKHAANNLGARISEWDGTVCFGITVTASGCTYSAPDVIAQGGTATVSVSPFGSYQISTVEVTGASYAINENVITVYDPAGPVTVAVTCLGGGANN